MIRKKTKALVASAIFACVCFLAGLPFSRAETAAQPCEIGAYRMASGEYLVITPSDELLRYRLLDGRSGRLYRKSSTEFFSGPGWASKEPVIATAKFAGCKQVEFHLRGGPNGVAQRVAISKTPARFVSDGNSLYGELYLPPNGKPRALVVGVYGSGRESATANNYLQHLLPLQGIATFIYDKRGTGTSEGRFSVDFDVLANDAVAALQQARRMLGDASVPSGFMGESQGGWIAPLAATRTPVDFTVVAFGLAVSPLEESREEITDALREKGYGDDAVAKAMQLTDVTARIVFTHFKEGVNQLAALKKQYAQEPWLPLAEGDFTGLLIRASDEELAKLRETLNFDISMYYEPEPVLSRVDSPMLWVLGGEDTEAPSRTTLAVLKELQPKVKQLDIALFPHADHGIIDVEVKDGERTSLGHSPGYHQLLADWMATRKLSSKYGDAQLMPDR